MESERFDAQKRMNVINGFHNGNSWLDGQAVSKSDTIRSSPLILLSSNDDTSNNWCDSTSEKSLNDTDAGGSTGLYGMMSYSKLSPIRPSVTKNSGKNILPMNDGCSLWSGSIFGTSSTSLVNNKNDEYDISASLLESLEHLNVSDALYSTTLSSSDGLGAGIDDSNTNCYSPNSSSIDDLKWDILLRRLSSNNEGTLCKIKHGLSRPRKLNTSPTNVPSDATLGFKRTSLCKYWQRGICANEDCNFAHGKKELRSTIGVWKTTICHHWKTGVCRIGQDCRHAHGEEELQPKNIPANVLKNKLLNSAKKYEYMRKKRNPF